mgnify:CR=1 FL=1
MEVFLIFPKSQQAKQELAQELEEILAFANRAASVTCSRSGAIPAMPTLAEIQ